MIRQYSLFSFKGALELERVDYPENTIMSEAKALPVYICKILIGLMIALLRA